jgi:hypothetical protein
MIAKTLPREVRALTMSQPTTLFHELERRLTDGIEVRLLWCEKDGRVLVTVDDAKTGSAFSLEVGAHERALDVFHHPFAYAAWRRIATRAGAPIAA